MQQVEEWRWAISHIARLFFFRKKQNAWLPSELNFAPASRSTMIRHSQSDIDRQKREDWYLKKQVTAKHSDKMTMKSERRASEFNVCCFNVDWLTDRQAATSGGGALQQVSSHGIAPHTEKNCCADKEKSAQKLACKKREREKNVDYAACWGMPLRVTTFAVMMR